MDVGLIVAHGNGNPKSDNSEAHAIRSTFAAEQIPITGFKWSTGHTLCASGVVDAALTTYALENNCAPGIANLNRLSSSCEGLALSADHQSLKTNHALLINRGFAGMNACMVIKACE